MANKSYMANILLVIRQTEKQRSEIYCKSKKL